MTRPTYAHIDAAALRHNLSIARKHAGAAWVMAVVKANGYGHDIKVTVAALADADGFAVASLDEAVALRECGCNKPVLLLEGIFDAEEIALCSAYKFSIVIHNREQIDLLRAAKPVGPLPVFLKLNSGMNRLGFDPRDYARALADLEAMPMLRDITLMSHFATADDRHGISGQMETIRSCFDGLPYPVSLANSAALFRYPSSRGQWVRPGIALYGASPFPDQTAADLGLLPAMTLHSRIIATQSLPSGAPLGYGQLWTADKPSRIGVVACGYADGYPRHAPTGTPILVDGQRTRIVGRVSMDMLFADLTELPAAGVGSQVILWGKNLPVELVAESAGTVNYELLCARAARVGLRDL
ncbi:MAG TPA: alanine racemase [Burkholderiales bacterium]|nr:alanine racemase [Burkholderiales bacterium]